MSITLEQLNKRVKDLEEIIKTKMTGRGLVNDKSLVRFNGLSGLQTQDAPNNLLDDQGRLALGHTNPNQALDVSGHVQLKTAGNKHLIKEGTNASMGSAVLSGGAATISTTLVTANSRIFLCSNLDGGTVGFLRVVSRTAGTSFLVNSSSGTDTSTFSWLIIEPA